MNSTLCRFALVGALVLATAAVAPLARAQQPRPRIVVAVLASGDVPADTVRDIQDLFLTALAKHQQYELIDRQTIFETTNVRSDVDLLLCVNQPACITQLHTEHRYEQFVLIKVDEAQSSVKFTAITFNYTNDTPIDFTNPYAVPADNIDLLIDRAFSAAEEIQLVPVGAAVAKVDPCAGVTCDDGESCVKGDCTAAEAASDPPLATPDDAGAEVDWLLWGGVGAAGVGVAMAVTSLVFYLDAQSTLDDFSASYTPHGGAYVSDLTQRQGRDSVDSINSAAAAYEVTLAVSLVTLAAGGGLLAYRFLLAPQVGSDLAPDPSAEVGLSITPLLTPHGAGLGAALRF